MVQLSVKFSIRGGGDNVNLLGEIISPFPPQYRSYPQTEEWTRRDSNPLVSRFARDFGCRLPLRSRLQSASTLKESCATVCTTGPVGNFARHGDYCKDASRNGRRLLSRSARKTPAKRLAPPIRPPPGSKSWSKGSVLECSHVATFGGLIPMSITKLSSRDFNQDTSRAKRAAKRGPVFITDRGRPSHVLLTVEEYQRITGGQKCITDLLAMPAAAEIEFEPPRLRGNLHKTADLT